MSECYQNAEEEVKNRSGKARNGSLEEGTFEWEQFVRGVEEWGQRNIYSLHA